MEKISHEYTKEEIENCNGEEISSPHDHRLYFVSPICDGNYYGGVSAFLHKYEALLYLKQFIAEIDDSKKKNVQRYQNDLVKIQEMIETIRVKSFSPFSCPESMVACRTKW